SGLEYLRQSVQLLPNNPTVHYHIGVALAGQNQPEPARRAFSKALSIGEFPEADEARQAMAGLVE
ncbi:MAG: hypothetical protein O7E57_16905, partial [Gammaproteobacteria bacterium]|nr:hypothetical protein [Gammaproteobacteria bacterium]